MAVAVVVGIFAVAAPTVSAKPKPGVPLLDTMLNNQINACATRPVQGGTTNGYEKLAATFSVENRTKVSSVVLPLAVVGTSPGQIEIAVVATKAFAGDPTGSSSFWDWIPDEAAVLGRTTATVSVTSVPCGQSEFVTAEFKKQVHVEPGALYWVVAQNPAGQTNTFTWNLSASFAATSTHAIYIVDINGARWLSYAPGTFAPNGIRVLGK